MKQFQKLVTGIILLALCAAAFAAPGIVGKWKGHIDIDWAKIAKAQGPQAADKIAAAKKKVAAIKLSIDFKADKTFVASGGPGGSQSGTWSISGNKVDLMDAKAKKGQKQEFTLAKNGKTMAFPIPGGAGIITLTKS